MYVEKSISTGNGLEPYFIDFADVSRDEMVTAMIASFHGNNKLLESLLDRITAIIE